MTEIQQIHKKLSKPFPASAIEWRIQSSGIKDGKPWAIVLPYVTSRAIMNRLDAVVGPDRWNDQLEYFAEGWKCKLSILFGDSWISHEDTAPMTKIEAVKGGASDALKRVAVKFGIGRYLYYIDQTFYATFDAKGKHASKIENQYYRWNEPQLPRWALPETEITSYEQVPEEIKAYFESMKYEKKDIYLFCSQYEWNWSAIKIMIHQQENNPT